MLVRLFCFVCMNSHSNTYMNERLYFWNLNSFISVILRSPLARPFDSLQHIYGGRNLVPPFQRMYDWYETYCMYHVHTNMIYHLYIHCIFIIFEFIFEKKSRLFLKYLNLLDSKPLKCRMYVSYIVLLCLYEFSF